MEGPHGGGEEDQGVLATLLVSGCMLSVLVVCELYYDFVSIAGLRVALAVACLRVSLVVNA